MHHWTQNNPDSKEPADLYSKALSFLAKREYSQYELHHKLLNYSQDSNAISALIEQLQQQNLLSNERFAENYARSYAKRGKGPYWIEQQLIAHELEPHLIHQALEQQDINWQQITWHTASKKIGNSEFKQLDFTAKAKLLKFMQQRGFPLQWVDDLF